MGRGRSRKGFKNPWETQPQVCCQHWGSGKSIRNAESCGRCFSRLLSQCAPQRIPGHWIPLDLPGTRTGQCPTGLMAQQKGWKKQKASQGQNPPARMTLGTGDCPGQPEPRTSSVEPAADTWHPFPRWLSLTPSPPLSQEELTKRWICLTYH